MAQSRASCPDCGSALQPMKLLDATEGPGWDEKGMGHIQLGYAAPEATRSLFLQRIERMGTVTGKICPDCGRILLYGQEAK